MGGKVKPDKKSRMKPVYFPLDESELLEYADTLPNFSKWVKERLRQAKELQDKGLDPAVIEAIERLIDVKLANKVISVKEEVKKPSRGNPGGVSKEDLDGWF